jgi:hypothetical protein
MRQHRRRGAPDAYTLDGFSLLQQIERRLGESRVFLGANFQYSSFDTKLDLGLGLDPPEWFPPLEKTIRSSGVGVRVRYDSRDSIFTPDAGTLHHGRRLGREVGSAVRRKPGGAMWYPPRPRERIGGLRRMAYG